MEFKFNATIVDSIEQQVKTSIGNAVSDNTVQNITRFIEKAGVNDDGRTGMSRSVALKKIDDYLEDGEKDTDDLVLEITESLVRDGFLSRQLQVEKMKELKKTRIEMAMAEIDKALEES